MTATLRGLEKGRKYVALRTGFKYVMLALVDMLLLSIWLGSMIFFAFGVAQSAFAVLPDSHMAGLVVASTLSKIELIGLGCGPLLIVSLLSVWRSNPSRAGNYFRLALLFIMTLMAGISRFLITPAMSALRNSSVEPIDRLAQADPVRLQFDSLHHYSVALLSVCMFSGLVVLALTVHSWVRK
ncbi:MAG TPA: DUF4149 domain-containing protein [Blastocatellia bacterium]|nr:DUF4149 domain-containing protein [Blastocatellia bacterium]